MKSRFLTLVGLILIVFVSQAIWVTYSPILTNVAQISGVSDGSIGLLAIIYPIFFLILTIPVGILLDKNFKLWLTVGSILTFASGAFRIFSPHAYIWLLGFQVLGAIGQPFSLNAFALFASTYFEKRKPITISMLSFSVYLGTIFSLAAGEYFYNLGGLHMVFLPTALISVVGIVLFLVGILGLEARKPEENVSVYKEMKYAVRQRNLWVLGVILGLGVAAYDNLSTWLQPVIQTIGMGQVAGTVVALTLILGLVGILILPNVVTRKDLRTIYLRIVAAVVLLIFVALAFVASKVTMYALLPISGFIMLPAYPIIMEWISRFYAKSRQGIATGFMAFVSRIFSVVFTLSALVVISSVTSYFLFLSALILGAVVFTWFLPRDKKVVPA
ncbi:MAG: MFS transporter [Thermoplasmatales archaeon]|jgi:major facilitator 4 family protein|nr:MFS transporter [Candidatus Thermoplasmatota archaeon]MDA8054055.1 MFS transporter [Thermoplasmatales archaeon]